MEFFFIISGIIFLIFRIWIGEFRLKNLLEYRRHFISRIGSYYYCFTLIFAFKSEIFNLVLLISLPLQLISLLTLDMNFFIKFWKENTDVENKEKFLLYLERVLLHPPLVITSIIMWLIGTSYFFNPAPFLSSYLVAFILFLIPWFFLDKRSRIISSNTTGVYIFGGVILSFISAMLSVGWI
ncbi:MAG: hypothetical protein GY870_04225 [archaeon]|nr:hypothetical protein [archaeon]